MMRGFPFVAVALFQLNRRETVEPVVRRLQKETDPEIQRNLIRTLGNLGAREQMEVMRRSQTDPALLAEVEQQIGAAKMRQDLEGTATPDVPRSRTFYGFFAGAHEWLLPGAYVLLVTLTASTDWHVRRPSPKWLPQLHSDNTTKGDYVWVKVALLFWSQLPAMNLHYRKTETFFGACE